MEKKDGWLKEMEAELNKDSNLALQPKSVLGVGGQGTVVLCYSEKSKIDCAVKVIKMGNNEKTKYILREVQNLQSLRHPHIVRYYRGLQSDEKVFIVMEYMAGGNLYNYVISRKSTPEEWTRWFFQQVVVAIDYCHRKDIVIRDIKPENILLSREHRLIKICDFGFSKSETLHGAPHTGLGTLGYIAPEIVQHRNQKYDGKKVDIWDLGLVLYFMTFGNFPSGYGREQKIMLQQELTPSPITIPEVQVRSGNRHIPISQSCRDLMHHMLKQDPKERATMQDILKNPWFLTKLPEGVLELNDQILRSEIKLE